MSWYAELNPWILRHANPWDKKNRERVALTQLMIYVTVDEGEERDSSTKPLC